MKVFRFIIRIIFLSVSVFLGIVAFVLFLNHHMDDFVTEIPWTDRALESLLPGIVGFLGGGIIGAIGAWVIGSIGIAFMGTGIGVPVVLLSLLAFAFFGSAGGFLGFSLNSIFDFVDDPSKYEVHDGFYGLLIVSVIIGIFVGYSSFKALTKISLK